MSWNMTGGAMAAGRGPWPFDVLLKNLWALNDTLQGGTPPVIS